MYKVGMYGGSFDPLHIGHINCIVKAACQCDELYIIISWSKDRDNVPKELRYRWIINSVKHLPNVKTFLLEDTARSKDEYNSDKYWQDGADQIKKMIGKPIDVVFCGNDYEGKNIFEKFYPDSDIVYFDRNIVPISSTEIRKNPIKYWKYIPEICRHYYTKKVLIVGSESTGKSTLVQNLALVYNTNFVSEVGRDTCEYAGGEDYMIAEDLYENLLRQKINVMEAEKHSNKILFVDTDAITTLFYSNFLGMDEYEKFICEGFATYINAISRQWDLVIFLEPTVEFVQDGTRSEEIARDREKYSEQLKDLFDDYGINFETVNGDYLSRFKKICNLIYDKCGVDVN